MTAITGDDGESPAHAPKESAAHWLEGGAGEMASGSGPQQPRRQERRRISAVRERRRACQRMPNRVVPRSSRFVPVTGTGRFFMAATGYRREARKGQGMKSRAGSRGGAPCRVWGSRPNVPHREAPKKQESQRSRRRLLRFRAGRIRARRTLTGLLYGPALMKKRNKRGRAYQPRLNRRLLRSLL